MWARGALLAAGLELIVATGVGLSADKVSELQARFDHETDSVRKAKLLEKLGDAEFEAARRAGQANDYKTVGMIMEKYRDNARAATDALKKGHPDAERHSNGYRQLEMHVQKGLREVGEILVVAPPQYKPPLEIVRQDLAAIDDELLSMLFPRHPQKQEPAPPAIPPPSEKHP